MNAKYVTEMYIWIKVEHNNMISKSSTIKLIYNLIKDQ